LLIVLGVSAAESGIDAPFTRGLLVGLFPGVF